MEAGERDERDEREGVGFRGGDARQTCRASYWVRLQKRGAGRCGEERKGLRVAAHLHSPIKFLYFETYGMRQNRVRRVSLVTGGTTNSIGTKTEVMNGEEGSVQGQHTDITLKNRISFTSGVK